MSDLALGYRIVGDLFGERRVVHADRAFAAYSQCAAEACVEDEAYLSAFQFGSAFSAYMAANRSTRGYAGLCCASWLHWDIDEEADLGRALDATRCLALRCGDDLGIGSEDVLVFFSGGKGFHVGVPTSAWRPEPSIDFNLIARDMAMQFAATIGVTVDPTIYDKVRAFRAPNSRHPKTGLHKRRLSVDELLHLSLNRIRELAREPGPFDVPIVERRSDRATAAWADATARVRTRMAARVTASCPSSDRLTRDTVEFIKSGAANGERSVRLFRAAANLAELGCTDALAFALLEEPARDCGLTPSQVKKQIKDGLTHARRANHV